MTKFVQIAVSETVDKNFNRIKTVAALDEKGGIYTISSNDRGSFLDTRWVDLPPHPDKGEE